MLAHKASLKKVKKTEIISSIFLTIMLWGKKSISRKNVEVKHMLQNSQEVIEEIKEENFKNLVTNKNGNTMNQNLEMK